MDLSKRFEKLSNERSARPRLEEIHWSNRERHCPFCAGKRTCRVENERPMPYRCSDFGKYFNVRTDMGMQGGKVPLRKWIVAICLRSTCNRGMSSIALHPAPGVTQKPAWMMAQTIREGWNLGNCAHEETM